MNFTIGADSVESHYATIHMAGDISQAEAIIRKFCDVGACVQVAPCNYIYTRGQESGFTARIMNYARFPRTPQQVWDLARDLADILAEELSQKSFSIETNERSVYFVHSDKRFAK